MEDLGKVIANLDRVAARAYAKLFNKSLFSEQANVHYCPCIEKLPIQIAASR